MIQRILIQRIVLLPPIRMAGRGLFLLLLLLLLLPTGASTASAQALRDEWTDEQLLEHVQRQTFRYFYDFGHPDCGLARERSAPARRSETGLPGLADIVTTGGTGFGMMAFPIAVERGWLPRSAAVERLAKMVDFLRRVERFHGAWAHWYDGRSGRVRPFSPQDDGGDLVETAFLLQGLLTVRAYFDADDVGERRLRRQITQLWHEVEWDWYAQRGSWLHWHWSPRHGFAMDMPIVGFDEAMVVYVLAVASPAHAIDPALYHSGWAMEVNPRCRDQGNYIERLRIGEHNAGGPLFFTHLSYLGLTPYLRDRYVTAAGYRDYADHHRAMALYNYRWCQARGYPRHCWGLTSSDDPQHGYFAHAPEPGRDNGTIAPTAALASIVYTPAESLEFLRYLWEHQRESMWTEYGFRDAMNLRANWYAPAHLAIDQGPIIVMIENYRTGKPWHWFMGIEEITTALDKIGLEATCSHAPVHLHKTDGVETSCILSVRRLAAPGTCIPCWGWRWRSRSVGTESR
jgi:hypothetical protein